MKEKLDDGKVKLTPSDWRYAAAILGTKRILDALNKTDKYEINGDEFIYNPDVISEDEFVRFLHIFYGDEFHHLRMKKLLLSPDAEKNITEIKQLKNVNSVCRDVFKGLNFDGTNAKEFIDIIDKNDSKLTKETFKFGKSMYDKYCNKSSLGKEDNQNEVCRIKGYYIDYGPKGRSLGYNYQIYKYDDIKEFDYICFGFSKSRKQDISIFINSNFSITSLSNINEKILDADDVNYSLVKNLITTSGFIDNNVEIIIKRKGTDYFETLILNKQAINIFKSIEPYYSFSTFYMKIGNDSVNIQEKIIDAIVNNQYIDHLINIALKNKSTNKEYNKIYNLIKINQILYKEDEDVQDKLKPAFAAAKQVNAIMGDNKVRTFKEKLISAITIDDKDTVSKTLLKLSQFSGVYFGFANDIFDDYDSNKNVLYTFINTLATKDYKKGDDENEEE